MTISILPQVSVVPARNSFAYMPTILRIGRDWFARRCPSCHHLGYVGIYPGREESALTYITRRDWRCCHCQAIADEVAHSQI